MKVALLADLHLGSKAIGDGRWKQHAIESTIVPRLRELGVTHLIFPGDTLDFRQGPGSMVDEPGLVHFAAEQFRGLNVPGYLLPGNHDDRRSCSYLELLAGPKVVRNDWVDLGEGVGAYLMLGGQSKQAAIDGLDGIDLTRFRRRVLVLHEDLEVFHDNAFLAKVTAKFDLVVNGHNHVFREVRHGVHLLPAALPWEPRRGSRCDFRVKYFTDGEIETTLERPWGFVVFGQDLIPELISVDPGVRIVICEVEVTENAAEEAICKTLDSLIQKPDLDAKTLAVRVFVTARLAPDRRELLETKYGDTFFDGVRIQQWQGSGVVSRGLRERLPTEELALNRVQSQHGETGRKMVEDLAPFFHLKKPGSRKDQILQIICNLPETSSSNGANDPTEAGSESGS